MSYKALTARVAEAEHRDELDGLRRCYDGLLAEYPLSYGHWKCYADHELRHGGAERAAEVYERGVAAVGTCVELWSFYAAFAVSQWNGQPARVRALFERAAGAVGDDYAADALWDRYIAFEMPRADASATPDHGAVGALYRRVLRLPLRALDMYRARLAQLASACTAAELLDGAAEAELHAELARHGAAPPLPASAAAEGDDEGARKLRVLPLLEARCALTRSLHAERLRLEGEIRRRHWHVKPLDDEQRQRWRALLEWEEARQLPATTTNGDGGVAGASNGAGGAGHGDGDGDGDAAELEAAAVRSYERCLVPCSDDAELWLRYAAFLEGRGKLDAARAVLARASGGVLLRGQVAPTLAHAAFEEAHGDHAAAEALLERAWSASTSAAASASASLEVCLARANLARRRADPSGARAAYRQGLVALRGDALAFLAQHAAHFERRCGGGSGAEGAEAAVALVEAALAREPTSARLIDLRLRLEIDAAAAAAAAPAAAAGGVRHVHDLFERLLAAPCELPAQLQAQLRTRWLAFADEHATSVADVRALEARLRAAATAAAARAAGVKRRRDADSDACAAAAAAPAAAPPPPPPPPSWDAYAYQQYGQQQYAVYAQAPQPHWYGAPDAYAYPQQYGSAADYATMYGQQVLQ